MQEGAINSNIAKRSSRRMILPFGMAFTIGLTAALILYVPTRIWALEAYPMAFAVQPVHVLKGFESPAAMAWGAMNRSLLNPEPLRRYDLHCPAKVANSEGHWTTSEEHRPGFLPAHACRKQSHRPPPEEIRETIEVKRGNARGVVATLSVHEQFRVYLVRRGDSLWDIARNFDMNHQALARINDLKAGAILQVGRPLKVAVFLTRELKLDVSARSLVNHPSLVEQIRMTDGHPVPRWMVTDFEAEVIDKPSPITENRALENGVQGLAIIIRFQLVKNQLEGKARQYESIVLSHAQKYNLDPALVMAMIHTESAFDPNARSRASAYGLMQLVPHTAGEDACRRIYGERCQLTPEYLYDPNNNIALGTAYLDLLTNTYLGSITDPLSRTYCAVAAYHAGPSNVGRAFVPAPSIQQAARVINSLQPAEVYRHLVEGLPSIESRNYVRDVIKRIRRYSRWYSQHTGGRT